MAVKSSGSLHTVGGGGWAEESPCVPLPAWGIPDFLRQRVLWSGSFRQKKRLFLTILHADSAANAAETPPYGRQTALLRAGSGVCVQNSKKQLSFFEMRLVTYKTHCRTEGGAGKQGTCFLSAPDIKLFFTSDLFFWYTIEDK